MALVVKDRVRETSTTAGTGTLTLNGAVTGFQSFSVIGDGNTTYYTIVDAGTGAWEVGIGTYSSAGTSLSRDTVLESSNSGSLVNFGSNLKDVFVTYPAERSVYTDAAGAAITPATASVLGVASGGTGQSTFTNGQLLIGNSTGNTLTKATLTAGTGISITNGTGSITVAATNNGDVVGPASSTDNAVARFDSTTGKIIQNSGVIIDDSNNITGVVGQTMSGNLTLNGTAQRIIGDFSNATIANRVMFQTSTTNGNTVLGAIPNGTGAVSAFILNSSNDPTNSSTLITRVGSDTGAASILSAATGTATLLPMTFQTGGSERVRIDTSGNVGIGTSTPAFSGVAGRTYLTLVGTGANGIGVLQLASSTAASTNNGNIEWINVGNTSSSSLRNAFISSGSSGVTANNLGSYMDFATKPDGVSGAGSVRMRINNLGDVGIGTQTPATALHVYRTTTDGVITAQGLVTGSGGTGKSGVQFDINGAGGWAILNDTTAGAGGTRTLTISTNDGYPVNSVERMRIDSGGNVGINAVPVNNTVSKLFMGGDFTRVGQSGSYSLNLYYDITDARWEYAGSGTGLTLVDSGSGNYTIQTTGSTSGTAGAAASLTERIRFGANGNVSIGTTSTNARLTVQGSGSSIQIYQSVGSLRFASSPNRVNNYYMGANISDSVDGGIHIGRGADIGTGTCYLFIGSGGQVGVGTTSPSGSFRMDVVGGLRLQDGAGYAFVQYGTDTTATDNWHVGSEGNGDFNWYNGNFGAGTRRMYLTSGGAAYNSTGTWGTISDARLKENIVDASGYLDRLMQVRVVKYSMKEEKAAQPTKLGVIAQELQTLFPGMVHESGYEVDGDPSGPKELQVKMSVFIPMLIKAVQELKAEINAMKGN